jgi:ATP:corrinoid adenosyltransferase
VFTAGIGGCENYARYWMDIAAFCTESRVLVVAGKGGVGKTTTAAALALMAANHGLSVLLVELEGRPALAAAFGEKGPLDYEDAALFDNGHGSVRARGSPPTTRWSSTWRTTASSGSRSGWSRRG